MNFQKVQKKNRKAISPVLATVILIAITLIAAIAIAGFVFGLFGTFTATAQVQASVTSCTGSTTTKLTCNLVLTNSGNANTATNGVCSITAGGQTVTAVFTGISGDKITVPSGGSLTGTCINSAVAFTNPVTAGSQVTGSVILNNGGNALFSATAS